MITQVETPETETPETETPEIEADEREPRQVDDLGPILRDIAFVLHVTQRVKDEMRQRWVIL